MDSHATYATHSASSVSFVFPVTIFYSIRAFLSSGTLLAGQSLRQAVPDASHEDGTEQVLKGYEGVMDAQQQGGQLREGKGH